MKRASLTLTHLLTWLLLLIWALRAVAALPDSLSYQGYLTDGDGTPLNQTVSITFRLYNVDSDGIALWADNQSVSVTNGLFSVQLGSSGNQLPPDLFNAPIWLGIEVENDGEMIPRKALTSVGFAFRALQAENDADTLASLQCSAGEVTKYDGTAWICAADEGSMTGQFNALGVLSIPLLAREFDVTWVKIQVVPGLPNPTIDFQVTINTAGGSDIALLYDIFAQQERHNIIIDLPQYEVRFDLTAVTLNNISYTTDESLIYPDRTQVTLDLSYFSKLEAFSQGSNNHAISIDMAGNTADSCVAYANYSNVHHIAGMPSGTGKFDQLGLGLSHDVPGPTHLTLEGLYSGDDAPCFIGATASSTTQDPSGPVTVKVYDPADDKTPLSTVEIRNVFIDRYVFELTLDGLEQVLGFNYETLQVQ